MGEGGGWCVRVGGGGGGLFECARGGACGEEGRESLVKWGVRGSATRALATPPPPPPPPRPALQVYYDPNATTYERLLDLFFSRVDPTTLNRQGNDAGTQYRSAIYHHNSAQKEAAEKAIAEVNAKLASNAFRRVMGQKVVTELAPAGPYFVAEAYHQQARGHEGRAGVRESGRACERAGGRGRESAGVGWRGSGMAWEGVGWRGMEWAGVGRSGRALEGVGGRGREWAGVGVGGVRSPPSCPAPPSCYSHGLPAPRRPAQSPSLPRPPSPGPPLISTCPRAGAWARPSRRPRAAPTPSAATAEAAAGGPVCDRCVRVWLA